MYAKYVTFLILILASLMGGCSRKTELPPTALTGVTQLPVALATSAIVPTSSLSSPTQNAPSITPTKPPGVTPSPYAHTSTPKPLSIYRELKPGQYVIYYGSTSPIEIMSMDGQFQGTFMKSDRIVSDCSPNGVLCLVNAGKISSDGASFANNWLLYNLANDTVKEIPGTKKCYWPKWGPDSENIVIECHDGIGHSDIYVISLQTGKKIPLTEWDDDSFQNREPAWSYDGRWIAYSRNYSREQPTDGIYLLDAACIHDPNLCQSSLRGPFLNDSAIKDYDMSFSPDSRHLAVASSSESAIYIIDIENETTERLAFVKEIGYALQGIAWSQDGEWFAVGIPGSNIDGEQVEVWVGINLLPVSSADSEPILLGDKHAGFIIASITIPYSATSGDTYIVIQSGHDLNLRVEPSLDGESLRKLQPGDGVTVLDGSASADGYTWWKLKADDGTEGWAVNIPEWYEPVEP